MRSAMCQPRRREALWPCTEDQSSIGEVQQVIELSLVTAADTVSGRVLTLRTKVAVSVDLHKVELNDSLNLPS